MKLARFLRLICTFVMFSATLMAIDLRVDPTFNSQFGANDNVYDVHVLANGQLLVAGTYCSGTCSPMVRRLNADGSIDSTFSVQIGPTQQGYGIAYYVKPQPNGQFLITGDFNVGTIRSSFVRINADGSIDPTMIPRYVVVYDTQPTLDGKYIVCGNNTVLGGDHNTAYRLNNDGTIDPSFRITHINGHCGGVRPLPDGKFLITANAVLESPPIKPLHRLNSDGSQDTSFNTDFAVGSGAGGLTLLPGGKILVDTYDPSSGERVKRLTSTGATEMSTPLCTGSLFLPLANGDVFTSQCRKWASGTNQTIAMMYPDGNVDTTLDDIYIDVNTGAGLLGFRDAGNGRYYAFGHFAGINGVNGPATRKLVRLAPNNAPPRAKFDFDGDGKSDLAVFRPSDRIWYLNRSTEGFWYSQFGLSTDALAAGHFDSDGRVDIGMFRDGTLHSYSAAFNHREIYIGQSGDRPMLGNFNDFGTNLSDFMVRGVRSGSVQWFYRDGSTATSTVGNSAIVNLPGELATDKPVVGDFNGDSRDDMGYFRDGVWYTRDFNFVQAPQTFQWGVAGDIPVPEDYDGDRQTDYAVFRPSTGVWWIRLSSGGNLIIKFGQNGDIPVPADYDGDGKVDVAIYRNGQWWQYRVGTGTVHVEQWGVAGDKPVAAQMQ